MDDELESIKRLIAERKLSYGKSAFRWKFSYRTLLIASSFLSAIAAALIGLNICQTLSAVCAAMAAVSTTAIASLEFEKNWLINKRAKHLADLLLLDIKKGETDKDKLINGLKAIVKERINESTED
jgi:hypothetical protein